MTSLSTAAATVQRLSLAAMEEASRRGQRDADLEHLFLALVLDDQAAGRALRATGITLDAARAAVDSLHADQLGSLGVTIEPDPEQRIVFHETSGYEWTPRVITLLNSSAGRASSSPAAVLRGLLREPSGLIDELLARLGVSSAQIESALFAEERAASRQRPVRGKTPGAVDAFVPATPDAVWALLIDPHRMPDWYVGVGAVDPVGSSPEPGDSWLAFAATQYADGRPLPRKEQFRRRWIELLTAEQPSRIAWRMTYPDAKHANVMVLTIDLAPTAGGTQLHAALSFERRGGWRRLVGLPFRPLQRIILWFTITSITGGISRSFR